MQSVLVVKAVHSTEPDVDPVHVTVRPGTGPPDVVDVTFAKMAAGVGQGGMTQSGAD